MPEDHFGMTGIYPVNMGEPTIPKPDAFGINSGTSQVNGFQPD